MTDLLRFSLGWKDAGRRLKSGLLPICVLALLITICPRFVMAQELAATLSGQVTDANGAVIPHASIAISLNGVNGIVKTIESDGAGNYVASNLTAGTYAITVTAKGFETFKARNITLNVAEKHAVNVQLKVGAADTTITVEDNPISVDLASSAQAGTITGEQVTELEISSRNFEQLVTLQPGVVNAGLGDEASANNTGLAVNGARPTANNWTVDGADINDSGSNQTIVNIPSIDAIQEFTLQRGSYDAGYGRSGGGQVLVQTKQGTSSFHGDLYEFDRNTDFDANDYWNKHNPANLSPRSIYHYNDFGFTVGGPIYIPGHYNSNKQKTFFFYSQEWKKQKSPSGAQSFSAANANDIAGLIEGAYIPSQAVAASCYAYNNTNAAQTNFGISTPVGYTAINPACESQNAKVYNTSVFSKFLANDATGTKFNTSWSTPSDFTQEIARIDHNFNDKLHFFARGMHDSMPTVAYGGLWSGAVPPGLADNNVDSPGYNVVGNLTWTASSKLVNEFEFVFAQGNYKSTPFAGQFFNSTTANQALTSNYAYVDPYGRTPNVSITNVTSYGGGNAPYAERNLDRTYFDNLTYLAGKHTLRAGFQIQQMIKTENGTGGDASFNFNNTKGGDASWSYGDFLLGQVNTYGQVSKDTIPNLRFVNAELYLQDDWKISHKLTVNLGVRWSRYPTPSDANGTLVNFDPLTYNPANAANINASGNFVTGNPSTYGNGIIAPKGGACEAAIEAAPLATCSPYNSKVNPDYNLNFAPRIGFAYNPDGNGKTSIRGGFGIFYDRVLDGIWEDNAFHDQPLVQAKTINNGAFDQITGTAVAPAGSAPNGMIVTGTPYFKVPSYANFNLSVQRQLLPTTTVEVAYVGNTARHLIGQIDLNQPTITTRNANPNSDINAIRPYLGYDTLQTVATIFTNNYNALQVSANHKAHGLTMGLAYTWSKDLTTNSADRQCCETSNTYDVKMDYGPSTSNTPQVFEASYIYDLPWYKEQHGLFGRLAGGWEISGITSIISGNSQTVTQSEDPFNSCISGCGTKNEVDNRGLGLVQQNDEGWWTSQYTRANQISSVKLNKTTASWFSTGSFAKAQGAWGTEHNGSFLGPGLQRWDFAAIKNVKLTNTTRFQLRGEFFNVFNHENFSNPNTNIDSGSFGTISNGHAPRYIQLAGKLYF